jgi:hypothetical protein
MRFSPSGLLIAAGVLVALLVCFNGPAATSSPASAQVAASSSKSMRLTAFRGHFGGGGFGFGRRRGVGAFGTRGRHPILRRIGHALFFAWLLHLFFSSGAASLVLWVLIIALVVHLFRRGRRRRYAY